MCEEFEIDDILKPKKKKVDGGKKGKRTERNLAKILSNRFKAEFSRSVGSGNRWSHTSLPEHATQVYTGDIVCPENFRFVLESKGGYNEIDLNSIFSGNKTLDGFLEQVTKDADRCGRKPMLLWKRDRKPWLAALHTKELKNKFEFKIIYKKWSIVELEKLLQLEDSFFLN